MQQPIRIRARASEGITEVTVLMPHPMETGMRKDSHGELVPAHHITEMQITVSGRIVLSGRMSIAVSRDPLLSFRFKGGRPGEPVRVSWTDNQGRERSDSASIV